MSEPELINMVGGCKLDQELHLENLCENIEGEDVWYEPEQWAGLYVRFEKEQPAILVFSSGKYNIAGADSENQILETNSRFIKRMSKLGITIGDPSFEIRNRVYMKEFDREFDLNALTIGLGMENTEYEPEQFPGIFYDNTNREGVFLIFRTGKVILTGVKTRDQATSSFRFLREQIINLLS